MYQTKSYFNVAFGISGNSETVKDNKPVLNKSKNGAIVPYKLEKYIMNFIHKG